MNFVNDFLHQLSEFSWFLRDENLQGLLRYVTAFVTLLFSVITFYLKLKEKRGCVRAQLAVAKTSWDSRTGMPVYPLLKNIKFALFPFVASDLEARKKGPNGWFTITEFRVWNAGQEPLWGSAYNPTVKVQIEIKEGLGVYALRACLSNDVSVHAHIGRVIHAASGQQRLPIYFDILRPHKGILVQIWHNSQDGSEIGINAISDQASHSTVGVHYPIKARIVKRMNSLTLWLVLPLSVLTVLFIYSNAVAAAVMSGAFTWLFIISAYLYWKMKPLAPEDLGFSNKKAKIIFYHGLG